LTETILVGRMKGVPLSRRGEQQANELARLLAGRPITAVHSSPQQRATQTAAPIAQRLGLPLIMDEAIDEIDVGEWTGRSFISMQSDPLWDEWNRARGSARPPRGESMAELQRRVVDRLHEICDADPNGQRVLVSHAEPIRAAVLHAGGLALDDFHRIEIPPASVSIIVAAAGGLRLTALGKTVPP
jgi:probable phosphoglycerate mutase